MCDITIYCPASNRVEVLPARIRDNFNLRAIMDEETSSVVLLPEVKVEPIENAENNGDSEESSVGSPTDENSLPRFGESSEEDIQRLLEHRSCSENTWRSTKNAVKILRDYMEEKSMDVNFENLDKAALNDLLRKFYVEARKKNGDYYKSSALGSIRFGILRYLQSQQSNIDIKNDPEFTESNKIFKAQVEKLKKQGKGEVNRSDIGPDDLKKLYLSDVLSPFSADGLQRKVFFDLLMYLPGKRNRSNVREQTRDTFLVGYDSSTGLKYIYPNPAHCENVFTDGKCPRMNEKPGKLFVRKQARVFKNLIKAFRRSKQILLWDLENDISKKNFEEKVHGLARPTIS